MPLNFANRTVIVTGAAQGIGYACAMAFLEEGASVILADIQEDLLAQAMENVPREHTKRALPVVCDVGNAAQVDALMEHTVRQFGGLDVLVANAAVVHKAPFLELREDDFDRVMRVNVKGTFLCAQRAARAMVALKERGKPCLGSIITLSSVNAVMAIPDLTPYVTSKGAINQLTKSMALSLAPYGIRVNAVAPGSINTALFQKTVAVNKTAMNMVMARTPMGRPGEPEEIANIVMFLAGDGASYMTGQIVYADGGRLALNYTVSHK